MKSCLALPAVLLAAPALAQTFALPAAGLADPAARASSIPQLARAVLASDSSPAGGDRARDDRFQLMIVAGDYAGAVAVGSALHESRVAAAPSRLDLKAANAWWMLYAQARLAEARGMSFDSALAIAYRASVATLDDRTNALVLRVLGLAPSLFDSDLQRAVRAQQGRDSISRDAAVALARAYLASTAMHVMARPLAPLMNADDARRYVIDYDRLVHVTSGVTLCTIIVRGRGLPARSPTILRYTIYNDSATDMREARRTASNEYVSVTGYVRGKGCGPGQARAYVNDASDASELIRWIARQQWSDGRVGMYSGSYEGFTQWAATKYMPKALKTIMTGAPAAPGIDVPMEGNIVWNFVYAWPFYAVYTKGLDTATYNDYRRFRQVQRDWYVSERAYRDLDKFDRAPNPTFDEWVDHPSYDDYWRAMLPSGEEWARIGIPVLQTAGYYYGGPGAALYYFTQHTTHRPDAEHYLVIGPYGHLDAQHGVVSALGDTSTMISGDEIDPVARIDIVADLRYQWFDYVFKHGPKPALLRDRVNYEVVGANVWKHAPSVAAMARERTQWFLSSAREDKAFALHARRAASDSAVTLTVDLKDRRDVDSLIPGGGVRDTAVNTTTGLEFVSTPFTQTVELSGLFSAHLELITNKKDFDFSIELFARTPGGDYLQIPPYQSRASFVGSLARRHLLAPGKVERLDLTSIRLASLRIPAGSRLVAVISVIKNPGQEINYGTGGVVADETIKDAGAPVEIRFLPGSYVEIPITTVDDSRRQSTTVNQSQPKSTKVNQSQPKSTKVNQSQPKSTRVNGIEGTPWRCSYPPEATFVDFGRLHSTVVDCR